MFFRNGVEKLKEGVGVAVDPEAVEIEPKYDSSAPDISYIFKNNKLPRTQHYCIVFVIIRKIILIYHYF